MAHHLINLLVILRDIGEGKVKPVMFLGQVKAFPDTGEHTQSQNIYLQEAQRFNIILVPFYTRPVCHPCIHDGTKIGEPIPCDHKSPRMLSKLPWKTDILPSELQHLAEVRISGIKTL